MMYAIVDCSDFMPTVIYRGTWEECQTRLEYLNSVLECPYTIYDIMEIDDESLADQQIDDDALLIF